MVCQATPALPHRPIRPEILIFYAPLYVYVCYNAGVKLLSVMQFKDWLILSRIISFHLTDCICRVGLSQHLGWARASYQS